MTWTAASLTEHYRRMGSPNPIQDACGGTPTQAPRSRMNKWEQQYAAELEVMRRDGALTWWAFEPVKLRLADKTHYTPDFMVVWQSGFVEFREVKGFWRDDARVKIKVAAEMFPFGFVAISRDRATGEWVEERFGKSRYGA